MKANVLFALAAADALLFGVGLLAMPAVLASLFWGQLDAFGVAVARLLGSALLGIGVTNGAAWNVQEAEGRHAVVMGNLVYNVVAAVTIALAVMSGAMNPLAWATVVVHGVLALGFGSLLWERRQLVAPAPLAQRS